MCIPSQLIPRKKALEIVLSSFPTPDNQEEVPVTGADCRVLAVPVRSQRTNPPVLLGGPDGIAVKSSETTSAANDHEIELEAFRVNTGMPMPEGCDAVIAIEDVTPLGKNRYRIHTPVSQYENTIPAGSDIKKDDPVMDTGHVITPLDIGALLTFGITEIMVKKWTVGLIATGDEIIPPYTTPVPGQIVDSNSYVFSAYLKQSGIIPVIYPIVRDNRDAIAEAVQNALGECDMVLVFGGSSAGSKDFTVDALEHSGELLFHGVAMGPGKPVTFAKVAGKPVAGMPGPSVAAMTAYHELVCPLLLQWGVPVPPDTMVRGVLTQPLSPFGGFDVFMMVTVEKKDGQVLVSPLPRAFGHMGGVLADAVLHRAAGSAALSKGDEVEVRMLRACPAR
ncbi:MAG: molybdopterin molybdotransferase MoeA [Methanoregula sp.]|jgi:putative molybdopterin biosynthesis protein